MAQFTVTLYAFIEDEKYKSNEKTIREIVCCNTAVITVISCVFEQLLSTDVESQDSHLFLHKRSRPEFN